MLAEAHVQAVLLWRHELPHASARADKAHVPVQVRCFGQAVVNLRPILARDGTHETNQVLLALVCDHLEHLLHLRRKRLQLHDVAIGVDDAAGGSRCWVLLGPHLQEILQGEGQAMDPVDVLVLIHEHVRQQLPVDLQELGCLVLKLPQQSKGIEAGDPPLTWMAQALDEDGAHDLQRHVGERLGGLRAQEHVLVADAAHERHDVQSSDLSGAQLLDVFLKLTDPVVLALVFAQPLLEVCGDCHLVVDEFHAHLVDHEDRLGGGEAHTR